MEELIRTLLVVLLYVVYILLISVVMIVATPFILLWPGRRRADGTRERKNIKRRYARIWKIWESIGVGLPSS